MPRVSPSIWGPCSHFLLGLGEAPLSFTSSSQPPLEPAHTYPSGGKLVASLQQLCKYSCGRALECGDPPSPREGTKALRVGRKEPQCVWGQFIPFPGPTSLGQPAQVAKDTAPGCQGCALSLLRELEGVCEAKSPRRPSSTHPKLHGALSSSLAS